MSNRSGDRKRPAAPRNAACHKTPPAESVSWWNSQRVQGFRRSLRNWYARHGRQLPWRETRDPYRVWLSEIMLQQTTVAAVRDYYHRFLTRFGDVRQLAAADEAEVLRLWEGLGYYSRARNLLRAARMVVDEHGGQFPSDVDQLLKLPGIGRYTAAAVASFAFDLPEPIVEANTQRLYVRLMGLKSDPRSRDSQQQLWNFAGSLMPRTSGAEFNSALTDLGSLVCQPHGPDCPHCPVARHCLAFQQDLQHEIPVRPGKRPPTEITDAAVVIWDGDRILLRQRGEDERWSGLWDFPRLTLQAPDGSGWLEPSHEIGLPSNQRQWPVYVRRWLANHVQVETSDVRISGELRHTVTRYRIRLLIYTAELVEGPMNVDELNVRWCDQAQATELPLSSTGRRIVDQAFGGRVG